MSDIALLVVRNILHPLIHEYQFCPLDGRFLAALESFRYMHETIILSLLIYIANIGGIHVEMLCELFIAHVVE